MTEQNHIAVTQAILVGLCLPEGDPEETEKSLDELERLLETAGGSCFAKVVQNKDHPDPRTCVGSGKVAEIRDICARCGIDLVIFDTELSPAQIRNLEDGIGDEVRVIDRSMLILDIFALHAVTGEGKLQVELAQLKYTAPRLIGKGAELSRLGGGIGTRGPGESKLESDRRHMKRRIAALEAELEALERSRRTIRAARDRSGLSKVAIVGYTNAGKSTLLNRLVGSDVAIVSSHPGTTRDVLKVDMDLNGYKVMLQDTAGLRETSDEVEKEGIKRAFKAMEDSVLRVMLVDVTDDVNASVKKVLETSDAKDTMIVLNKVDLTDASEVERVKNQLLKEYPKIRGCVSI